MHHSNNVQVNTFVHGEGGLLHFIGTHNDWDICNLILFKMTVQTRIGFSYAACLAARQYNI